MYATSPMPHVAGLGGASLLTVGFDTLADIVACTTLLMACVALAKLLPKRKR